MRRLHYFALWFYLLSVRAEKEDVQGYHTKQTKGTTVTEDLLKKENTIGHGTTTIPTEITLQDTAVAVTAKFPGLVLFDTRPMEITEASARTASSSRGFFSSGNWPSSLTSAGEDSSAMRIYAKSEISLNSNYEENVFSSTPTVFQSVKDGTSKPEVHLQTDAVKASFWLHTLLTNRTWRNTDSVTVSSADRGSGPILSASHPRVIDNLTVLHNDNDEERSQGKNEKGISYPKRIEHLFGKQSIFQSDKAEDRVSQNNVTNLCLPCLNDRRAASTENSVAPLALSPHHSLDSLSTESLALDLNQSTTSLPSLQQRIFDKQEDVLSEDISLQNIHSHPSFGVKELVHNLTPPPLSFKETENQNSQSFLSDRGRVAFDTSLPEMTAGTQTDSNNRLKHASFSETLVTVRQMLTTTVLYASSKSLHTVRKQVKKQVNGKKESIGDPQSKLTHPSKNNKNVSQSLSTNLANVFIQNQHLDMNSGPVSSRLPIAEAPFSSQESFLPEGTHRPASQPTARLTLTEAHSAIRLFDLGRPNSSAVRPVKCHTPTGRADSLALRRSQTPSKSRNQDKENADPAMKFITTMKHLTDKDFQTLGTANSAVTESLVGASAREDSQQSMDGHTSAFTITTLSRNVLSERLTGSKLLGKLLKITQPVTFDVSTNSLFSKFNKDTIRDLVNLQNLKQGDNEELTLAAEGEDKRFIKMDNKQGREKGTNKILKLQDIGERRGDKKLGSREESSSLDKTESREQGKIISVLEMNQNLDQGEGKMTNRKGGGGTTAEEGETLRQHTDQRQETTREKEVVEFVTKERAETRGGRTASEEDAKHGRAQGRDDVTNAPLGRVTNSIELNRHKGHTATNPSSCHSLIKQFVTKDIHTGEDSAQIMEMKNVPFSFKVTSKIDSTLRSQSMKLSRVTSFPEEPNTQIKLHPSTHGATITKHGVMSSLTEETHQTKTAESTFSVTAMPEILPILSQTSSVGTLKLTDAQKKQATFPHISVTKPTRPAQTSTSNVLSLATSQLAITAGFQGAQPRHTVNSSALSASIIYSLSDHKQKLATSVLKANSPLQTMEEGEQAEHTSVNKVKTTVKNPAVPQHHMHIDSSTGPPTTTALLFVAHVSMGHLEPHRGQSGPQLMQSSSSPSDMTSGQPCSLKLSDQTAATDTLHASTDDNKQRCVQALMTSASPKAKNDQFPISSMSPLLNLVTLAGDSLPDTHSLARLTRSAAEKEISNADSANSGRGMAESLSATDPPKPMTFTAKRRSYGVTKSISEMRDEDMSSLFIAQTAGTSKHHSSKLAVSGIKQNNHGDLFAVDGRDEANTLETTLESNHLSHVDGYNETSSEHIVLPIEQAVNKDFVPVGNGFVVPALNTTDGTGTAALLRSDNLHIIPQIPANDVVSNAITAMKHLEAKSSEKEHDPSTQKGTESATTVSFSPIDIKNDFKTSPLSLGQVAGHLMTTKTSSKTSIFLSLAPVVNGGSLAVSTDFRQSVVTAERREQVVFEESSEATGHMVQSNRYTAPPTTGKDTPAVKREGTAETQIAEERDHKFFVRTIEGSLRTRPYMTTTPPFIHRGQPLLNTTHRAVGTHDTPPTMAAVYPSFGEIKMTPTTSAFEVKPRLDEKTPATQKRDRAEQHKRHALSEKTSISQVIHGAVTDALPPTVISPMEIIIKTICTTAGCAQSGETTETTIGAGEIDHTAAEKMYKERAGNMHFNAPHSPDVKPENTSCTTDCPISGAVTPQATNSDYTVIFPGTSDSHHDYAAVDETTTKNVSSVTSTTRTWATLVETDNVERRETREQPRLVEKTAQRQSHRENSEAQEAITAEVTLPEPEATAAQTTVRATERILLTGKKTKMQLNKVTTEAERFEAQNATRSARSVATGETTAPESGPRPFLPEHEPVSEVPWRKHRSRISPHPYLTGVTEVSDDLCGSGNYTAEMNLNLGRGVEPGDTVPATGNLRVVINLRTNNTRLSLAVTSCCLSPTIQLNLTNSTCFVFSRLAAEHAGIKQLPSILSTSASFTISLFQMINYSVVYLHCDLSVCLQNRSDCERLCLQQRSLFPFEDPGTKFRNRISFGPMMKEVNNSTSLEEIDPSELDLVLVIVSLVVASSFLTVTLLLVWFAYRRWPIWRFPSGAAPRACCGCLHPGGDSILP